MTPRFIPLRKLESSEEITVAIYRAVVEVFAATWAGRPLKSMPRVGEGALLSEALNVRMRPHADGVEFSFPDNTTKIAVLGNNLRRSGTSDSASTVLIPGMSNTHIDDLTTDNVKVDASASQHVFDLQAHSGEESSTYTLESLRQIIRAWGRAWTHVSIDHSVIKFAVRVPGSSNPLRRSLLKFL